MAIIWLIAFLGLLLVEFLTVGLVSIWFAIGALAALVSTALTNSLIIQTIVFAVVSIISLLVTRPLIKKFKLTKIEPTNLDRVIGKVGEITKDVKPMEYGEVKVLGTYWTACSKEKLVAGTKVVIDKIDGSKLVVRKEGE